VTFTRATNYCWRKSD